MPCPNCDPTLNDSSRVIKTNKARTKCAICDEQLIGRIGILKPMKCILILGIDGYIGWSLALHLLDKGYTVGGIDNYSRRQRVRDLNSDSLTPIACRTDRQYILKEYPNYHDLPGSVNLHESCEALKLILQDIKPDSIIHLAEQPSAPWSMIDPAHCIQTQHENIIGTLNLLWAIKEICPKVHLIKLGTMGEYGTPDCIIPEGTIPEQCLGDVAWNPGTLISGTTKCPMSGLPFPRSPGSFYHLSKVHDTHNIIFACKTWGLTSTDIMQGVVFGLNPTSSKPLLTRFDYDEHFGTVINRFCAQAISNHPLTIYGSGNQLRGYLLLTDSLQCINLIIDNPPTLGTYRTVNQYESIYSITNLANIVSRRAKLLDLEPTISHISNPRTESQLHKYNPVSKTLTTLGYKPSTDIKHLIHDLLTTILPFKEHVNPDVILPKTNWR